MQYPLWTDRMLVWFSCGAASAVASKMATQQMECEVLYCDTLKYEHPDNMRFMQDVSQWIGQEIKILRSPRYTDIFEVFRGERFLKGPHGAPCTRILKRDVRMAYSSPGDKHMFGLTVDEGNRINRFERENPNVWTEWILRDNGITKKECYKILNDAGIELPAMYRRGYKNNNCIGCVKGGAGYWNKIRRDFPESFDRMAKLERELNYSINDRFLDELPMSAGRFIEEDIECGPLCVVPIGATL